ncbi:MAG: alpha amylase C-terminal domain-containing protein [Deltaproteobacteria bacterium]|nr:alpha amylase C-terminal domain-containing protein [Deltaproteobacteria bacterium]
MNQQLIQNRIDQMIGRDSYLAPFEPIIKRRLEKMLEAENRLTGNRMSLMDFASAHEYYGLHRTDAGWVFREWAPNATAMYLIGDFSHWTEQEAFALTKVSVHGDWEVRFSAQELRHRDLYRLRIHWAGGVGDRIPVYARRVHQDSETLIFNAQVWQPATAFRWRNKAPARPAAPLIYEAHVGMAQDKAGIGSYDEFTDRTLPRIIKAGYNTLQLMAIQQHPYYGSFGYHVANFFAASARFGPPEALKRLIDTAHGAGLTVLVDLVHSHAVSNEVEGLARFDGTVYQYFHEGGRGYHSAWDSFCFDYAKPQVLHFLLSNCRYWLDAFRVDGFRFDGVTSMLYTHHGLGKAFTTYEDYFDQTVDEDGLVYLMLANKLIHDIRPEAVTIAEDVSGMPGLAADFNEGGVGFDYRYAMGVADYWIKLVKAVRDEDWSMGDLWHELTNRRADEKSISYAESHDQALVGDQSHIFRLIGADMYTHMKRGDENLRVDRGMALHKMMRLLTLATAGHGYLNFMGNEFGHPEWIDFPRVENNWSYHYARRQWHLVDNEDLNYRLLNHFDQRMIRCAKAFRLFRSPWPSLSHVHEDDKVLAFERSGLLFVFNFHPTRSHAGYSISAPPGAYQMVLDTDASRFGGHGRLASKQRHQTQPRENESPNESRLQLYLPTRTAIVLAPEKSQR